MLELEVSNSSTPPIKKDNEGLLKGPHSDTWVVSFYGSHEKEMAIKVSLWRNQNMTAVNEPESTAGGSGRTPGILNILQMHCAVRMGPAFAIITLYLKFSFLDQYLKKQPFLVTFPL